MVVYPDAIAESSALIAGDTDLMLSAQSSEFARLAKSAGVLPLRVASGQFLNVNMGCDQKPFNDVRVRRVMRGPPHRWILSQTAGIAGNDTPINAAYPYYAQLTQKALDYSKAKALLAEAGYPNGLDLTLIASDKPSTRTSWGLPCGDGETGRFPYQCADHGAQHLSRSGVEEGKFRRLLQHAPTPDAVFSALYLNSGVERNALEQCGFRRCGDGGARNQ